MKGLILKDLYGLKKYYLAFVIVVLLFVIVMIGLFGSEEMPMIVNLMMCTYVSLITSAVPMTMYNMDENEKWLNYSGTMPVSRKSYVSSKYILGIGLNLFVNIIIFLIQMLNMSKMNVNILMFNMAVIFGAGLILPAVSLPASIKLGSKKNIISAICLGGMCGGIGSMISDNETINFILNGTEWYISLAVLIGVIVLYMLSWLLSILFYNEKEL